MRARSSAAMAPATPCASEICPCACCAAVGRPWVWRCTSCGEAAPPCVCWFMAAVGGCSAGFASLPAGGAIPVVSRFMISVGGCCGLLAWDAAEEAAPLWSAWLIAVVGGCCPAPSGAPDVGPDPASCAARIFDRFSISLVHWPAAAVPIEKASAVQLARTIIVVFMGYLHVPGASGAKCHPRQLAT